MMHTALFVSIMIVVTINPTLSCWFKFSSASKFWNPCTFTRLSVHILDFWTYSGIHVYILEIPIHILESLFIFRNPCTYSGIPVQILESLYTFWKSSVNSGILVHILQSLYCTYSSWSHCTYSGIPALYIFFLESLYIFWNFFTDSGVLAHIPKSLYKFWNS
jgi:hypothetical protein